jgi:hypothetical protein
MMTEKHLIGLIFLVVGTFGGIILSSLSQRIRDLFFMLMVILTPVAERMEVNFFSREWYRGTTRGLEFCAVDVLSVSLLVSCFLFPRRGEKRWFWPATLGLMGIYLCYACICMAQADPKLFGVFELSKMLRGIVVFLAAALYVRSDRELKLFAFALGIAVCQQGLEALMQRYIYGMHRVAGTVDDSNSLSMFLVTTAPVFVAVITARFPWFLKALGAAAIALAGVGVVLTISRAGVVTMGCVLLGAALATVTVKITAKKIAVVMIVLVATGGVLAKSWKTLNARFAETNFKEEYGNAHVQGRGYYIKMAAAIAEDCWWGVGPNNWSYKVSNVYGPRLGWHFVPYISTDKEPSHLVPAGRNIDEAQAAPAHSLAALTAGELGIGGLVLLTLLWARWLWMGSTFLWKRTPDPMRRMGIGIFFGMCGTFFQSLTEWVFHQTPIFFMFNIMLGTLASLYYAKKCARKVPATAPQPARETPEIAAEPAFANAIRW